MEKPEKTPERAMSRVKTIQTTFQTKTTTFQTNQLIIKQNGSALSLYDLKRPQIIKPQKSQRKPTRQQQFVNPVLEE